MQHPRHDMSMYIGPASQRHAPVQAIAAGSQQLAQAVTEHQRHAAVAAEAAATSIAQLEQQVARLQVTRSVAHQAQEHTSPIIHVACIMMYIGMWAASLVSLITGSDLKLFWNGNSL